MMYKCLVWVMAVLLAVLPCQHTLAESAGSRSDRVLIVCESMPGSSIESSVRCITGILTYMGKSFDLISPADTADLNEYGCALVLIDQESQLSQAMALRLRETDKPVFILGEGGIDQLSDDLIELNGYFEVGYAFQKNLTQTFLTGKTSIRLFSDPEEIYGGTLTQLQGKAYPLCARSGNLTQLAFFDTASPWMPYAAADLISKWMWPFENAPHHYGTYLVLDSVYPFEDLNLLMQVSDMLAEEGVPYAIMVMPVYSNATYPSMKRFCEYLRYAQGKGAAIVLRTPLISISQAEPDEVKERIRISYEAYAQYGVYPLALAAPESYLFLEDGLSILRGMSTVMLFETDAVWPQAEKNLAYQDGHTVIAPAYTGTGNLFTNVYPTAVYMNLHDGVQTLRQNVIAYRNSVIPINSLWSLGSTMYVGPHLFTNDPDDAAYFDGERVSLSYQQFEYDPDYVYQRGFIFYLADQIESSNRLILIAVLFFSVVLLFFILEARWRMKKQFLVHSDADEKGNDEGVAD